jgi:hypothetical protein
LRGRADESSRTRDGFRSAPPPPDQSEAAGSGAADGGTGDQVGQGGLPNPPLTAGGQRQLYIPAADPGLFGGLQGYAAASTSFTDYIRDIRATFPSLAHMPDTLLASQPLDALCRLADNNLQKMIQLSNENPETQKNPDQIR